MFNYQTSTVINGSLDADSNIIDSLGRVVVKNLTNVASATGEFEVKFGPKLKVVSGKSSIAYRKKAGYNGIKDMISINSVSDLMSTTGTKRYRLDFYIKLDGSNSTLYANSFVFKGRPVYIEFDVKANATDAGIINAITAAYENWKLYYGQPFFNISKNAPKSKVLKSGATDLLTATVPANVTDTVTLKVTNTGSAQEKSINVTVSGTTTKAITVACNYVSAATENTAADIQAAIEANAAASALLSVSMASGATASNLATATATAFTCSGGTASGIAFEAEDEFQRISLEVNELVDGGTEFDKVVSVDASISKFTGKQGFGDWYHITKDLRLPTVENVGWARMNNHEMPVMGTLYTQYILEYTAETNNPNGFIGDKVNAGTIHVFWVPAALTTAFETQLGSNGANATLLS